MVTGWTETAYGFHRRLRENEMTEQIGENLYRIGVPLPGNPLKELNSYLIRGTDGDLLIDTGFRREECRQALREGLQELGADTERIDVLLTHLHSDHAGLSREFAGSKRKIYITGTDMEILERDVFGVPYEVRYRRYLEEGFPRDILESTYINNPSVDYGVGTVDDRFTVLNDGDEITVGDYTLRTIVVPGHTPGNAMFWVEDQQIMFTGDHVLFDISPNITAWRGVEDSLGDYLDSLRAVREYPVKLALPGHRKTGAYRERIDALLAHHDRRLRNAEDSIREKPGMTAYEIAGLMRWKIRARSWEEFPATQKRFAVGECLSHLDYLRKRNRITRQLRDGLWRYFPVQTEQVLPAGTEQSGERCLAVLLPGMGYHVDKPLFYYTKKLLEERKIPFLAVDYGPLPSGKEHVPEVIALVQKRLESFAAEQDWNAYDQICLVGKSVGTAAAGSLISLLRAAGSRARFSEILYTPVDQTLPYLKYPEGRMIVFSGTADRMVDGEQLKNLCREKGIPLFLYPGANHSLETGVTTENLEILRDVMLRTGCFLGE